MIYLLIDIPLKISFSVELPINHPWTQAELAVDYLFMLDMVFNFSTGLVDESGFITDRRKIAQQYCKAWFPLDLITSFPFELVLADQNKSGKSTAGITSFSKVLKFARIMRLLKLLRILRLMKLMSQWEQTSAISATMTRLAKLLIMMLITAHISACGWVGVAMYYRTDDHSWENFHGFPENSWFVRFTSVSPTWEKSQPEQYLRALYWASTTLTTIGYGDITPVLPLEIIYTIGIQFIGSTLFGYIIGNVASIISRDDEVVLMIKEKIATVAHFLSYRQVPQELCARIRRHYEYAWRRSQVFEEDVILAELPHSVMTDCALHIHREIIDKVPFLNQLGMDVVPSIVTRLKPALASSGDVVLTQGRIGTEMFFVLNGSLAIQLETRSITSQGKIMKLVVSHIGNGESFSEYAVIMEQARHPASVVARNYCDMYMLSRREFIEFGADCPMAYAAVLKQGKSRYLELTDDIWFKHETQMLLQVKSMESVSTVINSFHIRKLSAKLLADKDLLW